jgi:hypothetical protein
MCLPAPEIEGAVKERSAFIFHDLLMLAAGLTLDISPAAAELASGARTLRNRCFQATAVQGMSSATLLAG